MASMYAVWHGPDGLKAIAERVNRLACIFADGARAASLSVTSDYFFDTVHIETDTADEVMEAAGREASICAAQQRC